MFVSGAQDLQIIRHRPISHLSLLSPYLLSPYCVCGKWSFMLANVRAGTKAEHSRAVPPQTSYCAPHLTSSPLLAERDRFQKRKWNR